jgi:MFS family permease
MSETPPGRGGSSEQRTPFSALQYSDFRLLWLGQFVSIAGTQMSIVAIGWQIYQLAEQSGRINPALALGLIGLARVIPIIITALFSGVLADRADRRKIVMISALVAMLGSTVLAATTTFAVTPIWLVYIVVALLAVASAFEQPALQALIPTLVPADRLQNAWGTNAVSQQLATIVGPALAGFIIAWGGVTLVYWIDAISFLAVIVAMLLIKTRSTVKAGGPVVSIQAALDGLRFVFSNRLIASTMLLDFFATFFGSAMTLLPLFAVQMLDAGPVELGWLYAAPAAGATLAAIVMSSLKIKRQGPVLLWAVAIFGICTAIFGLSQSLPLSLLALAGTGAADTVSMVIRNTMRQMLTPDDMRGRMTSVNMVFFAGGPQLGEVESGIAAALLGGPLAVLLGGVLCVVAVGVIGWRVGELRNYGDAPEQPAEVRQAGASS